MLTKRQEKCIFLNNYILANTTILNLFQCFYSLGTIKVYSGFILDCEWSDECIDFRTMSHDS